MYARLKLGAPGVLAIGAVSSIGLCFVLALGACESATNLDVAYGDASAALEGSANTDAAGDAGTPPIPTGSEVLPGCPCDESAGLGCCIPAVGTPFCTGDTSLCTEEKGAHIKCSHADPLTESACCWHNVTADGGATGAVASLAGGCDGGPPACTLPSDCAGTGQPCSLARCFGGTITIGACAPTAPACPQP